MQWVPALSGLGATEPISPSHAKQRNRGGKEINLRLAFEIASAYTMIKGEREFMDDEAKILERTYQDAMEHLVSPHQELSSFLAHIEEAERVNKSSLRGKLNLVTIHQAKGLEFKCVIIPGLNEGILPHVSSLEQTILNPEEERRLMYVAMTRTIEGLMITQENREMGQPITVPLRLLRALKRRPIP
jgi:superfamily I DNA/RNA helicase